MAGDFITVSNPYTVSTPSGTFSFGEPCTNGGQPYSDNGVIGGGNIVSHAQKDANSSAKTKG